MERKSPSLWYLGKVFLKLGFTAFGGYTALVAFIRKKLVEEDEVLEDQVILDSITLASVLPGPLAVNITSYVGFFLRGWPGALICMSCVLFPSVLLMIVLAKFQETFNGIPIAAIFLKGVLPVIGAVILSVAFKMGKKNIKIWWQWLILLLVLIVSFLFRGYFVFLLSILIAAIVGGFLTEEKEVEIITPLTQSRVRSAILGTISFILIGATALFLLDDSTLLLIFSKISLTLFGGGYVMIPVLHDIVVEQQHWIEGEEFAQAISFGQITPGPILVSATFIGYKVGALVGALSATVGIFLPPALLMIVVGAIYQSLASIDVIRRIFLGISPAILAYIIYSVTLIVPIEQMGWFTSLAMTISLLLVVRYNINFLWLMLGFGLTNVVLHSVF